MGDLADRIGELITERYKSVPKLAEYLHMPKQTIYSALSGGVLGSSIATMMPVIAALELDPFQLANGVIAPLSSSAGASVSIPLYGSIAAGQPIESTLAEGTWDVPVKLYARYPKAFFLRVDGESMNRILPNGCYALIAPCTSIDISGLPYALTIGDSEATIKRVQLLANGVELQPDSTDPTYHASLYDFSEDNTERIRVIGRVVWHTLPFDWSYLRDARSYAGRR